MQTTTLFVIFNFSAISERFSNTLAIILLRTEVIPELLVIVLMFSELVVFTGLLLRVAISAASIRESC